MRLVCTAMLIRLFAGLQYSISKPRSISISHISTPRQPPERVRSILKLPQNRLERSSSPLTLTRLVRTGRPPKLPKTLQLLVLGRIQRPLKPPETRLLDLVHPRYGSEQAAGVLYRCLGYHSMLFLCSDGQPKISAWPRALPSVVDDMSVSLFVDSPPILGF